MRKGLVYIIKNKCNEKVYIGQTVQSVQERFRQHLKPSVTKKRGSYKIYNAINKYGKENFYYEILENNIEFEYLDEKEICYISKYNSCKRGYNSTNGGDSKTICKIQDIEILKTMFYNKKTFKEIAEYFKVNKATVQRTLHSLNIRKNLTITKEYLLKNKDIKTNMQIAKEFEVNPATVSRAFKRFDIKKGTGSSNNLSYQNNANYSKEDVEKILHLSNEEIADVLGLKTGSISSVLKRYGLSKRTNKIKCIDYPTGE